MDEKVNENRIEDLADMSDESVDAILAEMGIFPAAEPAKDASAETSQDTTEGAEEHAEDAEERDEGKTTEVVGVRFKNNGKVYYFHPRDCQLEAGMHVVVETTRGVEYGEVAMGNRQVPAEEVVEPLKDVLRIATPEDDALQAENQRKAKDAYRICLEKIRKHELDMKLIEAEYTFDNNKVLFYFTAEGRIDFRDLVKDLASVFKTRIELRQVGVRDEAKTVGGLGICGRVLCCASCIGEFQPVSIKMAKEQGLSLSPTKISGTCGRLMCCLKYEQEAYEAALRLVPSVGSLVETEQGRGEVVACDLLRETVQVKHNRENETDVVSYKAEDVRILKRSHNGKPVSFDSEGETKKESDRERRRESGGKEPVK